MGFQKGQSGNPAGRPRGIVTQRRLRESIEADVPEILRAMIEQAKAGDVGAARLLLGVTLAPLKPTDQAVNLPLTGDLADDGREILKAAGSGDLTPEQAARLLQSLGALARIIETADLLHRVERLEAQANVE
jgi:plasmid stability protein